MAHLLQVKHLIQTLAVRFSYSSATRHSNLADISVMPLESRGKLFPVADAVPSYWRKEVGPIDNHRSTETLPTHADIVIIGSGYAGASIAHHLIEESGRRGNSIPSILILEAREACSGATGRNGNLLVSFHQDCFALISHPGGHLKPDPLSRAAQILDIHGPAVAEHVASFEARQVDAIKELVQHEDIQCDFEETRVTDVCFYREGRDKIKADLAKLVEANISTAKGINYNLEKEAEQVC